MAANTDYFKKARRKFSTTVAAGGISSSGTTLPLISTTGLDTDTAVVVVVDAGTASEEVIVGVVSGSNLISCLRGLEGTTGVEHLVNAVVTMYFTETHWDSLINGILVSLGQDGILRDNIVSTTKLVDSSVTTPKLSAELQKGWENAYGTSTFPAPNTITALGNRSYSVVFNSVDLTGAVSNGMRLKLTRTVAAPTQCTSLNGTTQYYNKATPTGMGATDNITVSAWIELAAYSASVQVITSRANGSTDGWNFYLNPSGQVILSGARAADDLVTSYQSVPVGKWVHVAASINSAGAAGAIYFDGVLVPSTFTNNANAGFLTPTADFRIGAGTGGTLFFGGKIAQVAVYSAVISQATILASMNQTLTGAETSLNSAYSFNNSINDLSANANNLTANGSAVATNADSPFGGQADGTINSTTEYGIVTKTAFSTNTTLTVQVPEGCAIPTSGGVSTVSYSTQKSPYGFPGQKDKWRLRAISRVLTTQAAPTVNVLYQTGGLQVGVPVGEWTVGYNATVLGDKAVAGSVETKATLTATNLTEDERLLTTTTAANPINNLMANQNAALSKSVTTLQNFYLNLFFSSSSGANANLYLGGDRGVALVFADCDFL